MTLDLSDEETAALARLLSDTIDADRYPLSPRIQTLTDILGKIRPEPQRILEDRAECPPGIGLLAKEQQRRDTGCGKAALRDQAGGIIRLGRHRDGWYFTGDTGYVDADGDLFGTRLWRPNSLLAGKIQGILFVGASDAKHWPEMQERSQGFMAKLPMHPNREFISA